MTGVCKVLRTLSLHNALNQSTLTCTLYVLLPSIQAAENNYFIPWIIQYIQHYINIFICVLFVLGYSTGYIIILYLK